MKDQRNPNTNPQTFLLLLSVACFVLLVTLAGVEAAINSCGDMFLRSKYAEIGLSSKGYQNSDCAASPGFHPREQSGTRLGFMYDRYEDGNWNTKVGDFSIPGLSSSLFAFSLLFSFRLAC